MDELSLRVRAAVLQLPLALVSLDDLSQKFVTTERLPQPVLAVNKT